MAIVVFPSPLNSSQRPLNYAKSAQFLRYPLVVPSLYLPYQRPRMNQGRSKEQPKNSQTQKVLFIKISVSFLSLIPCLIPPTDDRENSERTPTQLPVYKKCFFLRWVPKKRSRFLKRLTWFPKKLSPFLKQLTHILKALPYIPRLYTLHFTPYTRKIALKCDFSCTSANFVVPLHREGR